MAEKAVYPIFNNKDLSKKANKDLSKKA